MYDKTFAKGDMIKIWRPNDSPFWRYTLKVEEGWPFYLYDDGSHTVMNISSNYERVGNYPIWCRLSPLELLAMVFE